MVEEVEDANPVVKGGVHVLAERIVTSRRFREGSSGSRDGVIQNMVGDRVQQRRAVGVVSVERADADSSSPGNRVERRLGTHLEDVVDGALEQPLLISPGVRSRHTGIVAIKRRILLLLTGAQPLTRP